MPFTRAPSCATAPQGRTAILTERRRGVMAHAIRPRANRRRCGPIRSFPGRVLSAAGRRRTLARDHRRRRTLRRRRVPGARPAAGPGGARPRGEEGRRPAPAAPRARLPALEIAPRRPRVHAPGRHQPGLLRPVRPVGRGELLGLDRGRGAGRPDRHRQRPPVHLRGPRRPLGAPFPQRVRHRGRREARGRGGG